MGSEFPSHLTSTARRASVALCICVDPWEWLPPVRFHEQGSGSGSNDNICVYTDVITSPNYTVQIKTNEDSYLEVLGIGLYPHFPPNSDSSDVVLVS